MTKFRFLRSATLEELRANVETNLDRYRVKGFSYIVDDQSFWFEHSLDVVNEKFSDLKDPTDGKFFEMENCLALYDALPGLSPYEARDERLWCYLCHVQLIEHIRSRWPIPDDDKAAVPHIRKHFFAKDKRAIERDNAASRLWWLAYLCVRLPQISREKALEALLFRSDVRANIVERPTTSQSINLFAALLTKLVDSYNGEKTLFERSIFRRLMKEINSIGGATVLECLSLSQAEAVLQEIIQRKMGISSV